MPLQLTHKQLKELAKKDNKYASAELGSLEYSGIIDGKTDYQKCYEYYMKAAQKNHPKACWMVANLVLTKRINKINEVEAFKYLERR